MGSEQEADIHDRDAVGDDDIEGKELHCAVLIRSCQRGN